MDNAKPQLLVYHSFSIGWNRYHDSCGKKGLLIRVTKTILSHELLTIQVQTLSGVVFVNCVCDKYFVWFSVRVR